MDHHIMDHLIMDHLIMDHNITVHHITGHHIRDQGLDHGMDLDLIMDQEVHHQ